MEEEYNWNLILRAAVPIALVEAYVFYTSISSGWKWFSLIIGLLLTGGIVYSRNKKKNNVFTAVAMVFLVALIARFLKSFGVF
ncbi:LPXTG cell wall anchor domain-containing protein [Candidatus Woesearchaeota archaeon]|nr:LPXTG cell wall anchor domain-containing protein [Candidatus Woesearchaeota archaeon]